MVRTDVYSAGFCLHYVWRLRRDLEEQAGFSLSKTLNSLATFQLTVLQSPTRSIRSNAALDETIVAVYTDLICRGLPTLPSLFVEEMVLGPALALGLARPDDQHKGETTFTQSARTLAEETEWLQLLVASHIAIDPRLSPTEFNGEMCDSPEEVTLMHQILPRAISPVVGQFCAPQQPLDQMLPREVAKNFSNQRVDFTLTTPNVQLVIEVDGAQHLESDNQAHDRRRDAVLHQNGWTVVRIPTAKLHTRQLLERLRDLVAEDKFIGIAERIYSAPLWGTAMGRVALCTVLIPYAIARLQRTLLLALSTGTLRLEQARWRLAIIERDLPCAALALVDFQEHLRAFYRLLNIERELPIIELTVFATPEFSSIQNNELTKAVLQDQRVQATYQEWDEAQLSRYPELDLLLDVSVLQRPGYRRLNKSLTSVHFPKCRAICEVRSAYAEKDTRRISSQMPVAYTIDEHSKPTLCFFLRNLFRKADFREGQLEILTRTLALQPVIGLLPTGTGKSLCYQLSALLQPGLTIVIDPIISLIVDQIDNLRNRYAIDWLGGITSQEAAEHRSSTTGALADGKLKLIFLSPERLQSKSFRYKLSELGLSYPVAYVVIDEAHCVSEWGHDFRTAYLRLAETIRRYCHHRHWVPCILALTGTASYAVLADVQREIGVDDERAQIYPTSFDRKELIYRAMAVPSRQKYHGLLNLILQELPTSLGMHWRELYNETGQASSAGIIFTPHARGSYGARDLSLTLSQKLDAPVKFFTGAADKLYKKETQEEFKDNKFPLLVATKAFGMGIDKPNIRYTVHYNIPPSLEAFYQEAGRAGRDRQAAFCWLLFSDDQSEQADLALASDVSDDSFASIAEQSGGDVHRLLWLHRNTFRGVEAEFDDVKELYKDFIQPELGARASGETFEIIVPFGDLASTDQQGKDRNKALYRLSQLKIVQDYTLDYAKQMFEATVAAQSDEELIINVQNYMRRYKTQEVVATIPDKIRHMEGDTILDKAVRYLLAFVYGEIEKKRRAAIRSMLEVVRKASALSHPAEQDRYIRNEISAYLEKSPFTDALLAAAQRIEPADWLAILALRDANGISLFFAVDGVRQLIGGCRRLLESYLEHPGLLFLSSLGRLLLPTPDVERAMSEARRCFRSLEVVPISQRFYVALQILQKGYQEILQDLPNGAGFYITIAEIALEEMPERLLIHHLMPIIPQQCERVLCNLILSGLRSLNHRLSTNLLTTESSL
jgi:ATP-dependent DNA helicase RecQ